MALLIELLLALDGLGRVIGNSVECAALAGEVGQDVAGIPGKEGRLTRAFRTVATGELPRSHPIIAFEGLERLVWDTVLEACQIENAHERVAAADAVIEEGERLVADVAFELQGNAAQIHSERVPVHTVDAMGDRITRSLAHEVKFPIDDAGHSRFRNPGQGRDINYGRTASHLSILRIMGTFPIFIILILCCFPVNWIRRYSSLAVLQKPCV